MKSILLSIKPKWVSKILNGEKTIEIRKKFPKDYVGWVYIYCTKSTNKKYEYHYRGNKVDGKVVARFWCDKVEEIKFNGYFCPNDDEYTTNTMNGKELMKSSCLDLNHLVWYFDGKHKNTNVGYAIHISKLEVFDKPRELMNYKVKVKFNNNCQRGVAYYEYLPLTKAPQNYCFIKK